MVIDWGFLQVLNAGVTTFLSVIILVIMATMSGRLRRLENEARDQREIWMRLTGYLTGPNTTEPVDFAELSRRLRLDRRE